MLLHFYIVYLLSGRSSCFSSQFLTLQFCSLVVSLMNSIDTCLLSSCFIITYCAGFGLSVLSISIAVLVSMLGCLLDGANSFSTNISGGTYTLCDPNFTKTFAATFESLRIWWISNPWKFFSSFLTSKQYASMLSLVQSHSLFT